MTALPTTSAGSTSAAAPATRRWSSAPDLPRTARLPRPGSVRPRRAVGGDLATTTPWPVAAAAAAVVAAAAVPLLADSPARLLVVAMLCLAWPLAVAVLPEGRVPGACVTLVVAAWGAGVLLPTAVDHRVTALALAGLALGTCLLQVARRAPAREVGTVVVGRPGDVTAALARLQRPGPWHASAVCLTGSGRTCTDPALPPGLPQLAGVDQVARAVRAVSARAVLVLPCPELDHETLRRLTWELERSDVAIFVGSGLHDVAQTRARTAALAGMPVLHVRPAGRDRLLHRAARFADRVAALLALAVLLPLLLVLAAAVRLDSRGPVLFRQERVGHHGRPFTMLKLRTMTPGAEQHVARLAGVNEAGDVLFKIRDDPRTTRVGRVLRRWSLDELPQLWNVVRGDMALVGPRPALPEEVARYDEAPRRRLVVKPGLTGLWQVSGRSDLTWEESVRLDLHYVDNWTLWLDLRILVRTVAAVLTQRGAY